MIAFTRRKIGAAAALVLLIAALAVSFVVYKSSFSVSGSPVTDKVVFSGDMAWNDEMIYDYRGYRYSVTENVIPPWFVGRKIAVAGWNGPRGGLYEVYSVK